MKIQTAEMKEHVTFEALPIAIPARLLDQVLDPAINAFRVSIAETEAEEGHDIGPVFLEHASHLLDGLQSGRHGIPVPLTEKHCGIVRIGARPERAEQFFHLPCPCRFGRKGSQFPEASRPLLRHVLQAIQPQLPRPLEGRDRVTLFHFMFHASNLIHGPVHVTSQVKVVVDDLLCSIRNIADRRVPKGLPHVHRNGLHLFTLFSGQGSPEPIEAVLLPIILDGQHPRLSSVRTTHNGHVLMSPADRLLIHAQPLKGHYGASGESPVNRPLLDPVCLIPGNSQDVTRRRRRAFPQYINRQSLKPCRKPAPRFSPGNLNHLRPMRVALHPRHIGHQNRLVLATVQMPPFTLLPSVDVHSYPALRASPCRLGTCHFNLDASLVLLQRHRFNRPRRLKPQNLLIKFGVIHAPKVSNQ